ncbi:type I restriction enzyme HsdR N-terminal domain-containing protein [Chryseobacterium taihuense]|uniref:Type I restriction enzyme R protein N terminus (HSDR_N) n=1 Tax=Chryseobacterium taihuense TaxID=1141221 RepID=A0ABY0QQC2_9FLAO|nr:type I restriction enzyme HsdR N-terminal domain-containing protein [Chryseobacterium taihuense]SDL48473.1 Type I restriction enzyme R protein N terminus (HSDR_N) [Chryseobacterium taihuense]
MELPKLNFQETFDFKFKKDKDKFFIYDLVRKTYLLLTPEEWVRQHWIHYYLTVKSYSVSALITEKKILLNGLTKRIDLLITEKAQPKILIECKAPQIKLTEKTFEQTARYNSIIGASEIVLTNGLQHIRAYYESGEYLFYKA